MVYFKEKLVFQYLCDLGLVVKSFNLKEISGPRQYGEI